MPNVADSDPSEYQYSCRATLKLFKAIVDQQNEYVQDSKEISDVKSTITKGCNKSYED